MLGVTFTLKDVDGRLWLAVTYPRQLGRAGITRALFGVDYLEGTVCEHGFHSDPPRDHLILPLPIAAKLLPLTQGERP